MASSLRLFLDTNVFIEAFISEVRKKFTPSRMIYTHPEDSLKDALENLAKFSQTTTNIATNEVVTEISQS